GSNPYAAQLGDFNGDGFPDLSTANYNGNSVSVFLNTTRPQLQLVDGNGAVRQTGVPSANLDRVLTFVAPSAGTYYARVSGTGSADYNLVVTRNAAFDTEANDTPAQAQPLSGLAGALGYIAPGVVGGAGSVVPGEWANVEAPSNNGFPFNIGNLGNTSMRYQQAYDHTQFAAPSTITAIRFRRDASFGTPFS